VSFKLKLDRAGIAEVLKSAEVGDEIDAMASDVATRVYHPLANGDVLEAETDSYTTDRRAAGVTVAHPAALRVEAKYGLLAQAASAAGLEVTARSPK
jgi:hypothetical protein